MYLSKNGMIYNNEQKGTSRQRTCSVSIFVCILNSKNSYIIYGQHKVYGQNQTIRILSDDVFGEVNEIRNGWYSWVELFRYVSYL